MIKGLAGSPDKKGPGLWRYQYKYVNRATARSIFRTDVCPVHGRNLITTIIATYGWGTLGVMLH